MSKGLLFRTNSAVGPLFAIWTPFEIRTA